MSSYLVMVNYAQSDEQLVCEARAFAAAVERAQAVANGSPVTDTVEIITFDDYGNLQVHWKTTGRVVPAKEPIRWPEEEIWEY